MSQITRQLDLGLFKFNTENNVFFKTIIALHVFLIKIGNNANIVMKSLTILRNFLSQ